MRQIDDDVGSVQSMRSAVSNIHGRLVPTKFERTFRNARGQAAEEDGLKVSDLVAEGPNKKKQRKKR